MCGAYFMASMRNLLTIFVLIHVGFSGVGATSFDTDVKPVLERYCFGCHGADKQKGKVRLDTLSLNFAEDARAAETWHDALDALHTGEMPPEDETQPTAEERAILTNWLRGAFDQYIAEQRETGGRGVVRRLNRVEYQRTMEALLGLKMDYAANLPPEGRSPDGFQNNGASLGMSGLQLEYMLQAARDGLRQVIVEGPEPEVFVHQASETVSDKKIKKLSDRLGRVGTFVARLPEFPDDGEFVFRIAAHAELPEPGSPWPRMEIRFGYRADTQAPSEVVGVVEVNSEDTVVYEVRGRMEQFPVQTRSQSKFPGMLVWMRNVYDDGQAVPMKPRTVLVEVEGKKKPKKTQVWDEDPSFPKVVVESFEFVGPVFTQWPPDSHQAILFPSPLRKNDEPAYVREVLKRFMTRAFRRPVNQGEVDNVTAFYEKARAHTQSLESAMRETLAMVLISPEFLYLLEPSDQRRRPLNDYERASRLSYFLWSSLPDDPLLALAATGKLQDDAVLEAEVLRMLADPRAQAFVEQFSNQWLDLDGIDRIAINPEYYPDFDLDLKVDMRGETEAFFAEVLHQNLSAEKFIDADFTVLNEPLARHYGIAGPRGMSFERVALSAESRPGGILAHGGILLANSTGEDSHPIKRAVWVLERLLHDPPAPPPPNVPNLDSDDTDISRLPILEQLEAHRENDSCANCHKGIDPWGIALEGFDAVGLQRTEIQRLNKRKMMTHPVVSTAELPNGIKVEGVEGLKNYLLDHKREMFAEALATKMLTYAVGRSMEIVDGPAIDALTTEWLSKDLRLRDLVQAVATSEPFLTK